MRSAALAKVFALTIICVSHSNSCGGTETQSEDKIITAIYRQVLRRDPKPEDLKHYSYALRYEKTVKETVKEICGTREFMQAITKRSTKQGIITCYERILARTPTDDELHRSSELLANSDWNLVISGLIESSEYKLWFGDLTVPYPRDRESQLLTYKPPEHREHRVGHAPGSGGSSGFSYHPSPSASPTKDGKPKVSATPASTPFPRATQESARLSIAPPPDEPDWDGRAAKRPTPWATSTPASGDTSSESRKALDQVLDRLGKGNIAFNTPESMAYGETKTIQLLLDITKSGHELEQEIIEEGLRVHAEVRVSEQMEAHLTGDAFEITPVTKSARQPVSSREATEWRWDVRAKRFSSQRLHLSLDAIIEINGKELSRGIRVFDRDIKVRVTGLHSAVLLLQDNWQLTTAVSSGILGALGWLLKRYLTKRTPTTP